MFSPSPNRKLRLRASIDTDWLQIEYDLLNDRSEALYVIDTMYDLIESLGPRPEDYWAGYSSTLSYVCHLEGEAETAFFVQGYTPYTEIVLAHGMVEAPPTPLALSLGPGATHQGCIRARLPLEEWHGTSLRTKAPRHPRQIRRVLVRVDVVPESLVLKSKEIPEVPGHVMLRSRRYSGWFGAIDLPEPVTLLYWERDFARFHPRRGFPEERD